MNIGTLARYLVGSRSAILELARSRWSLVVGLLLVISGGLARYYDGAYLPAEWTVLLHGVVVSTVNSFVIFCLVYEAVSYARPTERSFWGTYVQFLGLFWLTAPMAWLYAIPYERFMSPADAIGENIATLTVVSIWRVVLTTRVLSVLFEVSLAPVFFLVMVFADIAMFAAATLMPRPVVDFMGGIQRTEVERAVASSTSFVQFVTFVSFPIWFIGALATLRMLRKPPAPAHVEGGRVGARPPWSMIGLAVAAVLAWIPALTFTQREQRLRYRAESMLTSGHIDDALAEMSAHQRSEYPPVWDPPPRLGYDKPFPAMHDVRAAMLRKPSAKWVEEIYLNKSWRDMTQFYFFRHSPSVAEFCQQIEDCSGFPDAAATLQLHVDQDFRLSSTDKDLLRHLQTLMKDKRQAQK